MATLVLLQKDLRINDNPALFHAVDRKEHVIAAYIKEQKMGSANLWWVSNSFTSLQVRLAEHKIPLLYNSDSINIFIEALNSQIKISAIYSNGLDINLPKKYNEIYKIFASNLLFNHEKIDKEYKIFTPFWKYLCKTQNPELPLLKPNFSIENEIYVNLPQFMRFPISTGYNWWEKFEEHWNIGEIAANRIFGEFKQNALDKYTEGRNIPSKNYTSKLSPHIRFGEISVRQIYYELHRDLESNHERFMSELGWREFAYHLLHYHPNLKTAPLNLKYQNFYPPINTKLFDAWKKGVTGYPLVDAGMRQLWQTGWMHNRVRMITASFLTKNLLIPWQMGERWFFDCLVDADYAVNPVSWQWVAGCGTDSAPYFRIFNPILQGQTYDSCGEYVKTWVPELQNFNKKYIHEPSKAPRSLFDEQYAIPIVNLKQSREDALTAYRNITAYSVANQ